MAVDEENEVYKRFRGVLHGMIFYKELIEKNKGIRNSRRHCISITSVGIMDKNAADIPSVSNNQT